VSGSPTAWPADRHVELARSLDRTPDAFLSLDLFHIGVDKAGDAVRRRLERIAAELSAGRQLQVGAEQERRADLVLKVVLAVAGVGGAVSATVQANLKRSRSDALANGFDTPCVAGRNHKINRHARACRRLT
jgi:proline dehydrogenase